MAETITLYIQRWEYERGNYQIVWENGANFDFYSQERLTVNGERVRDRFKVKQALFFYTSIFKDTILDGAGELSVKVQCRSGLYRIHSRLLIDKKQQDWTDYCSIKWVGVKGEWPEPSEYEAHQ